MARDLATGDRRTGAGAREAIAHAFLSGYHRILAESIPAVLSGTGAGSAPPARQRAFAWRVTAARIPLVPEHRWPTWLLEHLHAAAATPVLGVEYRRQRELLVGLLAGGASGGRPPA